MGHPPSKQTMAKHGRWTVDDAVARALILEARRLGWHVEKVASELLRYWYEDTFLPTQRAKEKIANGNNARIQPPGV